MPKTLLQKQTALIPESKVRQIGLIYAIYRMLIGVFLLLTNFNSTDVWHAFGITANSLLAPELEDVVLVIYITIGALLLCVLYAYKKHSRHQLLAGLLLDMFALTLLMYSGTAKELQIGLLFMVVSATSFMLLRPIHAIFITLLAILSLIIQQLYYSHTHTFGFLTMSDALLLSLSLFAVGFVSWSVSQRLAFAETIAIKKSSEVRHLNAINNEIIKTMVSGVLVIDRLGNLVTINAPACQLLNLPTQNTPSRQAYLFDIQKQLLACYPALVDWYLSDIKRPFVLPIPQQADRPAYRVRFHKKPMGDYGQLITAEDVSREENHAQQLKLASLGQLSASIAHEIRNPLGAISQAAEFLHEFSEDDPNAELYDIIFWQTKRVNRIIEDVMRLSRQEPPAKIMLDLSLWLPNFIAQHYPNESINVQVSPCRVVFDPHHLEQIMLNLLANALRHTQPVPNESDVTVKVHTKGTDTLIDIIDNGEGVAKTDLPNLFNPFFTKSQGGTGLGLYLSKAFSEANHARLMYLPNHKKSCFRLVIAEDLQFLD